MDLETVKRHIADAAASLQRGDRARAGQLCESVLAVRPAEPNALQLLGLVRTQEGRLAEAIDLLERSRKAQHPGVHLLNNLGIAYRRARRFEQARSTLLEAVAMDPRFAPAQCNLGNVLLDLEDLPAATRAFEASIRAKPDYAEAHAAIAKIAELSHDLTAARAAAMRALTFDPQHPVANLALARVDLREDRPAVAAARLQAMTGRSIAAATNAAITHGLLGQALDRLGNFEQAFAAFTQANAIQCQIAEPSMPRQSMMSPASVARLTDFVASSQRSIWDAGGEATRSPTFFVGFPRSGTTLVEQILAAHPSIATMEEKDILAQAIAPSVGSSDWLTAFAALDHAQLAERRALYWRSAEPHLKGNRDGLVIDKLPLNTILLAPAHRLFPDAKIIFALRDPRDVVLSCFQQTFDMNAAMFEFLTLETAARYYDAVMRLFGGTRAKLPLTLHMIRYEDLLADFEGETRRLLQFLEIPWAESVRSYRDNAKKRLINTPSASQVVRPLYTSARGKWRNYRAQLEPVLPLLEPWAQAFGYEPA